MSSKAGAWTARIRVDRPDGPSADRLERALGPEAAREVPRSRARISRPEGTRVEIEVIADDSGALRAAMNTYLGWIALALRADAGAGAAQGSGAP